jgi:hypothetical protein
MVWVLGAAACTGDDDSGQLASRQTVVRAFEAAGEPVRLKLDVAKAAPVSPIDAVYSARDEFEAMFGPFEIVVLEDEESAVSHAARLEARYGSAIDIVREKNVVLVARVEAERSERLVSILESL